MNSPEQFFDVQPSVGNPFAWIHTQIALQRRLMAATRTAVSLIGFGFTVAQLSSASPRSFRWGSGSDRRPFSGDGRLAAASIVGAGAAAARC